MTESKLEPVAWAIIESGVVQAASSLPTTRDRWAGFGYEVAELFTRAQLDQAVADERERWRGLLQEALESDTNDYIFGSDLADRMRAALTPNVI